MKTGSILRRGAAFAVASLTIGHLGGRETDPVAPAIAAAVDSEIRQGRFPGAVILVGTAERLLYHAAFGFAQLIPEKVREFCQREIFDPLEMREARFNKVEPSDRVVATHHPVLGENHNADGRDAGRAIGNAGLFCTASDLANFAEMMLGWGEWRGRRILSPETIEDFIRPYPVAGLGGWGFTWQVDPAADHRPSRMGPRAYGHSGNTGISIWIDPDGGGYTLVLTNRTHPVRHSKTSEAGKEEYRARGRIGDAALEALGY